MTPWVQGCQRAYGRVSRAFPHEFRMVCGDGMERLGKDVVPLVWRQQGALGLVRLFGDIALRLPVEYVASRCNTIREVTMDGDLFEGTWQAQVDESNFDGTPLPVEQACMRFEATDTGYLLVAYGVVGGHAAAERPNRIVADGKRRPVVDLNGRPVPGVPPGAMVVESQPDPRTLEVTVEADGKVLNSGRYRVSEDGKTLRVTNEGMGLQGPFKVDAVFERVVPDPYVPQSG